MTKTSKNLKPLSLFYESSGLDLPVVLELSGDEIPDPYRRLLVHDRDMTSTLSQYHHNEIGLNVLDSKITQDDYWRKVVLVIKATNIPVEFGAICIHLSNFDEQVKEIIHEGKIPLGAILANWNITYTSKPNLYFSVESDRLIAKPLHGEIGQQLYGRCNSIANEEGLSLADIVEILPVIS